MEAEHRDILLRLGRLEAENERLDLEWKAYRDELKRLVNRLEKRDQREASRIAQDRDEPLEALSPSDEITARVLARRKALNGGNNHGVHE